MLLEVFTLITNCKLEQYIDIFSRANTKLQGNRICKTNCSLSHLPLCFPDRILLVAIYFVFESSQSPLQTPDLITFWMHLPVGYFAKSLPWLERKQYATKPCTGSPLIWEGKIVTVWIPRLDQNSLWSVNISCNLFLWQENSLSNKRRDDDRYVPLTICFRMTLTELEFMNIVQPLWTTISMLIKVAVG